MRARTLARARRLDRAEPIEAERHIMFESEEDMRLFFTPERIRLCETAREQPRSIAGLAARVGRSRKAVHRDVIMLLDFGLLGLRRRKDLLHGTVQTVEALAQQFEFSAAT